MTLKHGAVPLRTAEKYAEPFIGSIKNALDAEIRLYDNLFTQADPEAGELLECINPDSLNVLEHCKVEASVKELDSHIISIYATGLFLF